MRRYLEALELHKPKRGRKRTTESIEKRLKSIEESIDSTDPLVYGAAIALLGVAAVVAMVGPARRGSNSDPLDALRCE